MKKTLALLLCLVMALSVLTACGSSNTAASTADQSTASDSTGSDAAAAPAGTGHKETLVIGTAEDINNLNLQTQKTANNNKHQNNFQTKLKKQNKKHNTNHRSIK